MPLYRQIREKPPVMSNLGRYCLTLNENSIISSIQSDNLIDIGFRHVCIQDEADWEITLCDVSTKK